MKKITTTEFIIKANEVHNNVYDYSSTLYTHSHCYVTIICHKHGPFNQRATSHLRGSGCPHCAKIKKSQTLTTNVNHHSKTLDQFLLEARDVHGNTYDYSKVCYKNINTKVEIICPMHGSFFQTPSKHIHSKTRCPLCSKLSNGTKKKELSKNTFTHKAHSIHDNRYLYTNVTYEYAHSKVEITCPTHGSFFQTPNSHLNGCGCPLCVNSGIFNWGYFERHPKRKDVWGYLYLTNLHSNTENFWKIGITTRHPVDRLKKINKIYTSLELNFTSMLLFDAFQLEQQILEIMTPFKYKPLHYFEGHTECFTLQNDDQIFEITNMFNELNSISENE